MICFVLVFDEIHYASDSEVRLPPTETRQLYCRAPGLVIKSIIAERLPNLIEIGTRKMVADLRQVFVPGSYFRCENYLRHSLDLSLPRAWLLIDRWQIHRTIKITQSPAPANPHQA